MVFFIVFSGVVIVCVIPSLSSIWNAFPHAEITVRSYISGIGVSYEIAPHGVVTIYDYDDYGRLVSISQEINGNRRIIEQYEYHFSEE